MKFKALLLALFTAGLAVSMALAGAPAAVGETSPTTTAVTTSAPEPEGKEKHRGKHEEKSEACKPRRKVELKGEFVAPATGGFAMLVTGGNKPAKAWKGKPVTVLVDEKSKFHGKKHTLAELAAGDRIHVQGYACQADLAAATVRARKVKTKGPKPEHESEETAAPVTTTSP